MSGKSRKKRFHFPSVRLGFRRSKGCSKKKCRLFDQCTIHGHRDKGYFYDDDVTDVLLLSRGSGMITDSFRNPRRVEINRKTSKSKFDNTVTTYGYNQTNGTYICVFVVQ